MLGWTRTRKVVFARLQAKTADSIRVHKRYCMVSSLSVFYDGHHGVDVFSEAGGAEGASTGGRFLVLNHWAPTLPSVVLLPHWSHLAPYSLRL